MDTFTYTTLPARVIFGSGTIAQLASEAALLKIERALILTTAGQESVGRALAAQLGAKAAGVFAGAVMHTPVSVSDHAAAVFRELRADGVIAIGGGSTIGLGKAIALRTDCPQIAIPTTYAGSEMTAIIGQTDKGEKTTQKTAKVLPETVIYDVEYSRTLPVATSITSGMNAIAHAVEALYVENANPVLDMQAQEGIARLMGALKTISTAPDDREARLDAAYGAWLCALCLANGGVALHHKICHVVGGIFDLPHAETHTVMLPHALAYNAPDTPVAYRHLQEATGCDKPAAAFFDLAKASGVATSLEQLGMAQGDLPRVVEATLANPYRNPRPLEPEALRQLMQNAWEGARPGV